MVVVVELVELVKLVELNSLEQGGSAAPGNELARQTIAYLYYTIMPPYIIHCVPVLECMCTRVQKAPVPGYLCKSSEDPDTTI